MGNPDARVTIVEFMDPACETCAAFSPFIKKIMAANPDKIKLVIRYAPFHHGADIFVKMLEAAGNQDKYWETLAAMFRSQSAWASHADPRPERIWEFLPAVGLDINQLKTDMNDPEFARRIKQDMADADTLKVRKTPGFFVNGRPLEPFGRQPLLHLIQEELEKNY
ncbi:MAG TPA: disulfide bond formation protein DsbA [Desulfobacteraceae bacterium]|nr:disulfide bond formation protein DsbA [Desulfobacteraceae bacterium]